MYIIKAQTVQECTSIRPKRLNVGAPPHKNGDEKIKVSTPQLQRYRIFNYVLTTGDVSSSNALRQSDEERLSSEYH